MVAWALWLTVLALLTSCAQGYVVPCLRSASDISSAVRQADVVLSGTVDQLLRCEDEHCTVKARVHVLRVFKGHDMLIGRRYDHVLVTGVNDPLVCDNNVRLKDTKVFLTALDPRYEEFRLIAGLLPINIHNLDMVEAYSEGNTYRRRKPIEKEMCEKIICAFHSTCGINATTGQPHCFCKEHCGDEFMPVCGSDNVTYINECFLHVASCRDQRRIRVQFRTACVRNRRVQHKAQGYSNYCQLLIQVNDQPPMQFNGSVRYTPGLHGRDEKDPCLSVYCQFGSRCVVSADGKVAQCICPDKCPSFGDSRGSRPLCGEDGVDYESLCDLERSSCSSMREIKVKYVGSCDPCAHVSCPDGTICKLDSLRQPVCRCSEQCPLTTRLVCASNGITYQNECFMSLDACKSNIDLHVIYEGSCESGNNPCAAVKCPLGQQCYVDNEYQPSCLCVYNCQPLLRMVCGKDGVTYDNECELKKKACRDRVPNSVEHAGPCGRSLCSGYDCPNGAICVIRHGKAVCQCPTCRDEFNPVCGSDGITYSNECKMRQEACYSKTDVFVSYNGFCDGCQNNACDYYAYCVSDGRGSSECRCPEYSDCRGNKNSVCGTDGITYESECHLKVSSCRQRIFIMVASGGACDSCQDRLCEWGARCENGKCVCPTACPRPSAADKVCGSDGRLYASQCYMLKASCNTGMTVQSLPAGKCAANLTIAAHGESDEPCSCHRSGSYSDQCDALGYCHCRPHVTGRKCDYCLPGFWGIHLISNASVGCQPCQCSLWGSLRDDCEQKTGRCACKAADIKGEKCDLCPDGSTVTEAGCRSQKNDEEGSHKCGSIECRFGSVCDKSSGSPRCVCRVNCTAAEMTLGQVCGSDGRTYDSVCQLLEHSCRIEKEIRVLSYSACQDLTKLSRRIVAFQPQSWAKVQRPNIYSATYLRAIVKPEQSDGVIFYVGQSVKRKSDFLSLSLNKGYIEFRYDVGDGLVLLKSKKQLRLDEWHEIVAERMYEHGMLSVSQQETVSSKMSKGSSKNLDVKTAVYLGAMPTLRKQIQKLVGVNTSFSGCVAFLQMNDKTYISSRVSNMAEQHMISECTNAACTSSSCENAVSCVSIDSSYDYCICPPKATGKYCEKTLDHCKTLPCGSNGKCHSTSYSFICNCSNGKLAFTCEGEETSSYDAYSIPEFSGKSFITVHESLSNLEMEFIIEGWFYPTSDTGIMFYAASLNSLNRYNGGDFILLYLVKFKLHFALNLGSGTGEIKTRKAVVLHKWHQIKVERLGRSCSMILDGEVIGFGDSPAPLSKLNIDQNLFFIGCVPNVSMLPPTFASLPGFRGAIQSVQLADGSRNLLTNDDNTLAAVEAFVGPPCFPNPCLNGGKCVHKFDSFICLCATHFSGRLCSLSLDASIPVSFDGVTAYKYNNRALSRLKDQVDNNYLVKVVTNSSSGLLLTERGPSTQSDFLAIALEKGCVFVVIRLGSKSYPLFLRSRVFISDGRYHQVQFWRTKRQVFLSVDSERPLSSVALPGATEMNTDGILWLGGHPELQSATSWSNVTFSFFVGCVSELIVQSIPLNLVRHAIEPAKTIAFCT